MISRRARLIAYGAPAIFLVGSAILMVTFPEMADRMATVLGILVISGGIVFVAAGLFRLPSSGYNNATRARLPRVALA